MKTKSLVIVIVLLLGIAVLGSGTKTHAQVGSLAGRTITGTVYFVSGRRPGLSLPFTLIINRITTPDEVSRLNAALREGKQDELLRSLSSTEAGRIQIGSNVGVPANAIMVTDQGNGQTKITVLYQRICGLPSCVMERVRQTIHLATRRCTSAAEITKAC